MFVHVACNSDDKGNDKLLYCSAAVNDMPGVFGGIIGIVQHAYACTHTMLYEKYALYLENRKRISSQLGCNIGEHVKSQNSSRGHDCTHSLCQVRSTILIAHMVVRQYF